MAKSVYFKGAEGMLHALCYGAPVEGSVPIVCLHGVTGTAWLWDEVARSLAEDRCVISLDLRGHGESDWSPGGNYSTQDHEQDLLCLVRNFGFETIDLLGLSWGALIGIGFAAHHPDGVRRFAIVDVEPAFDQNETDLQPRPQSFDSRDDVLAWESKANPAAPDALLRQYAYKSVRRNNEGQWLRQHDSYFYERWPFRADDCWDSLGKLTQPVLLANGQRSFVRYSVMEEMASKIPHARGLISVVDSGHLVPLEAPQTLAEKIRDFLKDS